MRLFLRDGRNGAADRGGEGAFRPVRGAVSRNRRRYSAGGAVRGGEAEATTAIGGTMTAGGYLLPGLVAAYMNSHPGHRLGLQIANTREISGAADRPQTGSCAGRGAVRAGLLSGGGVLQRRTASRLRSGDVSSEFSLAEYIGRGGRLILREEGSGTRYYFDRFLESAA